MNEHLDRELNLKAIVGFAVGLVVVTAVSAALMWGLSVLLRGMEEAKDPPPPALAAAAEAYQPPEPRLQTDPELELVELRAREQSVLDGYGWVDRDGGIARVPIDRAIEMITGEPAAPADPKAVEDEGGHH